VDFGLEAGLLEILRPAIGRDQRIVGAEQGNLAACQSAMLNRRWQAVYRSGSATLSLTGDCCMTAHRILVLALLAMALGACGQPVPPDKSDYVGEWISPQTALSISQDGTIRYAHKEKNVSKTVKTSLQRFEGNNLKVGFGPVSSTLTVSVAPHRDGDDWKMTVDGVELTKKR